MSISVIIPVLNEPIDQLQMVVGNLTRDADPSELEVIIYNDGSMEDDGSPKSYYNTQFLYPNIKILNNKERFGVGYAFDRGFEASSGMIIVLMGADIFTETSWISKIRNIVKENEVGCAVSVGLQPGNYDIDAEGLYHRYGATLTWKLGYDDLPKNSPLRKNLNYREIIACRWATKQSEMSYEIDAVYGAFYYTTSEFYERIHGFDTIKGMRFRGHMMWGHLESMLSLKAKVYGGRCVMNPDLRAGHLFGRIDEKNVDKVRSVREDLHYWNRLWIAHTMLDGELRDDVLGHLVHCLNLSQAQAWIRQCQNTVQEVRERNRQEGKLISK